MRPKDLMVGDWVILRDPDTHKETKVTIQWNDLGSIILQWFAPIPITPEILEKNGFVKQSYGYSRYFKPYDENYYCGFESISYFFDEKIAKATKEHSQSGLQEKVEFVCTYVHELQHALKLIGITKEIKP